MSRELSRSRRAPKRGQALLTDLARLPLEAAVDMVCARLAATPGPPGGGHRGAAGSLAELVSRIEEVGHAEPARAAAAAARVLGAGARAGGLGGGQAEAVTQLAQVALRGGDAATLTRLTAVLLAEPTQLGTALEGPLLHRCRRDPAARLVVTEAIQLWLAQSSRLWREHDGADAADGLVSALVEHAVARGDLDAACALARAWPPMRTALCRLGAALAGAGRVADLQRLAQPYRRVGSLFSGLIDVVTSVAASQGQRGEDTAAWLFTLTPSVETFALTRAATDPKRWPARRTALIGAALTTGEAPWLIAVLMAEPDAVDVLTRLIRRHPQRAETLTLAFAAVAYTEPKRAFDASCAALLDWLAARQPPSSLGQHTTQHTTQQGGQVRVQAVKGAATALGQPSLAEAWLGLVRREVGEAAPWLMRL